MPAQQLSADPIGLAPFDIVGTYAPGAPQFVDHVGFAQNAQESIVKGQATPVCEMGPPLRSSEIHPDVLATAVLTSDEVLQMKGFCELHLGEHRSRQFIKGEGKYKGYTVVPHARPLYEQDGSYAVMRFSCVGFVIEAYRDAGVDFIDTRQDILPKVPYETVADAYPIIKCRDWPARANQRFDLGLDTSVTQWPVVLPAYVFHALDRSDLLAIRQIPYHPQEGDERFPHSGGNGPA